MSLISDDELKVIVEKVVQRTMSDTPVKTEASDNSEVADLKTIALGADHGGYMMKEMLKAHLISTGHPIIDCGTDSTESVDYPDFALAVAEKVSSQAAWRGIIVDGAGIGSCMTANKVDGVRAAMCHDHATAVNSREHNDANVLTLGAGLLGDNLAVQIVDTFLKTEFAGGRHTRRVDKIMAVEQRPLKVEN